MTSRQMNNHNDQPSTTGRSMRDPLGPPSMHTRTQPKTTSKPLNFQKAMSDFHTMFPELDHDVIEAVLRANNGVVQTTIDQLLELQESTIVEKAQSNPVLPSYEHSIGCGEEPPPAYNDIWEDVGPPQPDPMFPSSKNASRFSLESESLSSRPKKTFPRNALWNAPLVGNLPDDFLCLSSATCSSHNNSTDATSSMNSNTSLSTNNSNDFMTDDDVERFLEDEKLAIFLQNEEFLRELRRNREFVSSLDADHEEAMVASGNPVPPVGSGGARPRTTPSQEDAQFRQKLKHMGKSTRKKFGKMAKKFSRSKSGGKAPPLGMTPSESTFNLLEDEPGDEQRNPNDLFSISEDFMINQELPEVPRDDQSSKMNNYIIERPRPRPSTKRQLPQAPGSQPSNTTSNEQNEEPIVFYGEDNEFSYKEDR